MLENCIKKVKATTSHLTIEQKKRLQIEVLIRLLDKIGDHQIEPLQDDLNEGMTLLQDASNHFEKKIFRLICLNLNK
ncbi:hypothetical protein IC619_014545 [Hazenella sp. IB182353]|uniref:hypothetical protein n=1 Tax=Polycladospora coralii TaxID=2771432 RepID=UPI001747C2B3|nr:hypothetical protein [Polycladospora coralii]MBS7531701.1 hypothetical protein [Polycladospora coralii]